MVNESTIILAYVSKRRLKALTVQKTSHFKRNIEVSTIFSMVNRMNTNLL